MRILPYLKVIAIVLFVLWFVGFVVIGVGGFIHIVLFLALVAGVFWVIGNMKPV